jgi:hypothetical protein
MSKSTAIKIPTARLSGITARLIDNVTAARADNEPVYAEVRAGREQFKAVQPIPREKKLFENSCELVVTHLEDTINSLMAHHVPIILGKDPIIHIEGVGKQAREVADDLEAFVQYLGQYAQLADVGEQLFRLAFRDKLAFAYVVWDEQYTRRRVWETERAVIVDEESGDVISETETEFLSQPQDILTYYGPRIIPIEIDQAGVFPADARSIDDAQGVWIRYTRTADQLQASVLRTDPVTGETRGIYAQAAVDELISKPGNTPHAERGRDD